MQKTSAKTAIIFETKGKSGVLQNHWSAKMLI